MQPQPLEHACYPGQFEVAADAFCIAIPRQEVIVEMVTRGEEVTLDRVCVAVAVVVDALAAAGAAD